MTENRGAAQSESPPRKVTAVISQQLHAQLHMAKLRSGKSLNELMTEAIELIVTHYRPTRKP